MDSENPLGRFVRALALIAGGVLLLLTVATVVDVFLRYVFNMPFRGSIEVTEFAMVVIVFLSIGYCGWVGGHVAVDLLERFLDRPALRLLPGLMAFVGAALFAFIAVQAVTNALGDFARASNMLRWPHYPFRFTVAFGSAVFALVLLVQGIGLVRRGRE